MRQFLAVTVLGATLAFGVGTALASDNVDYGVSNEPTESVTVSQSDTGSIFAGGGSTMQSPVQELRDENREH